MRSKIRLQSPLERGIINTIVLYKKGSRGAPKNSLAISRKTCYYYM